METTRRPFLGALAVASALSGATAAQAVVRGPLDADLIALGKVFDEAHATFIASTDRLVGLQDAYKAIAPSGEGLVEPEHKRWPDRIMMDLFRDPASPTYGALRTNSGFRLMGVHSYLIDQRIESGAVINSRRIKTSERLWSNSRRTSTLR